MEHPFECAVQPTTVKEHKLTHPVVYGWKVADAPSDHKQLLRNLRAKLMWKCFEKYPNKDWYVRLVTQLEKIG